MSIDFESQYEILGLPVQTDWPKVQSTYRKLVHEWHPDRHRKNEEDNLLAEKKFIQLTQAFNILRDFYRVNHRLPLQRPGAAAYPGSSSPNANPGVSPVVSDHEIAESGLLGSRKPVDRVAVATTMYGKYRFLFGTATIMLFALMTVALMYKLDKRNAQMARAERTDVMRQAEPSKFERSAVEIKRAATTGAFLEARPESSALGSQIRGDSFSSKKKRRSR